MRAQSQASSNELTLDQAIDLALHNNHAIKIGQLEVSKAFGEIAVAKTSRLPTLHAYTIVSGNLAKNGATVCFG